MTKNNRPIIARFIHKIHSFSWIPQTRGTLMFFLALGCFFSPPADAAINIPITVNLSETVDVTGTPRIPVDVGGITRYASYNSGTGTNTLTFTLAPQAGDVDLDGVTVSSPIDLNGGAIKDTKGNDATLTFAPPNTTNVKVNYPSLSMDFIADSDGRYTFNGTVYNDLTSFLSATAGSFTRTGTSQATYFNSSGVMLTAVTNTPRFDYDPITHQPKGILIEESRTNTLTYSDQINNAAWGKSNVSIAANATTAPDGTLTADMVTPTGGGNSYIGAISTTFSAGSTLCRTIYAKANVGSKIIFEHNDGGLGHTDYNLTTQTVTPAAGVTASMTSVGNGWYRLIWSKTFTNSSATASGRIIYIDSYGVGVLGNSVYLWGAQTEVGNFPTSYIPTTSTATTRGADLLAVNNTGSWAGSNTGAFTLKTSTFGLRPAWGYAQLWDGTTNNRIGLINVGGNVTGNINSASVNYVNIFGAAPSGVLNVGLSYAANNVVMMFGANTYTDITSPIPAINQLKLGGSTTAGTELNGWIQSFKYYPLRPLNSQLQLLIQ